jgi:hypothetical protein
MAGINGEVGRGGEVTVNKERHFRGGKAGTTIAFRLDWNGRGRTRRAGIACWRPLPRNPAACAMGRKRRFTQGEAGRRSDGAQRAAFSRGKGGHYDCVPARLERAEHAAPGSLAGVLCPETLQPPQVPDGEGTATGGRRARPGDGLPPPVPTQTSGGLLAVIECAYTCVARRRPPQVSLQLGTMITAYPLPPACDACRRRTQARMVGLGGCGPGHAHVKCVRAGRVQAGALG